MFGKKVKKLTPELQQFLKEGVLQDEYILDNIPRLLAVMRDGNVTLHWIILHTAGLPPGIVSSLVLTITLRNLRILR